MLLDFLHILSITVIRSQQQSATLTYDGIIRATLAM
jgi:hypothetical protein